MCRRRRHNSQIGQVKCAVLRARERSSFWLTRQTGGVCRASRQ